MLAAIDLSTCPNLAVPAEVMQHVAQVESGNNPFAIGVVGGRLQRQPRNLAEATATARMLERRGYNYSLGIAQVNRANLGHYGLHTYARAFDRCSNLQAGASILANCYARAGGDWGKAFSCYYSGNFVTGYRDGYVQRVYASMGAPGDRDGGGTAIPLERGKPVRKRTHDRAGSVSNRLVTLRSMALDTAAAAVVSKMAGQPGTPAVDGHEGHSPSAADAAPTPTPPVAARPAGASTDDVFHPIVRGPGDPTAIASAAPPPAQRAVDRADLRQEHADAAFVF
ncbi:lytic transglycosylase domain-containing protein [Dyella lutea]|uniref:lytic transglycosylase domain-containing protein n=1 Tax=Dyella lutea TaxID=2950441 RepID=UPI003CCD8BA4